MGEYWKMCGKGEVLMAVKKLLMVDIFHSRPAVY
jgi:hypothetical protein